MRIVEKVQASSSLPARDLENMLAHEVSKLDRRGDYEPRFVYEVAEEEIVRIEERKKNNSKMLGMETGIRLLDFLTFGFQKRKLYYIGGRPSQGKTSLLVNFAYNCNRRFGFLSAESGKEEIINKLFSGHGKVDSRKLTTGNVDNSVFTSMMHYIDKETNIPNQSSMTSQTWTSMTLRSWLGIWLRTSGVRFFLSIMCRLSPQASI